MTEQHVTDAVLRALHHAPTRPVVLDILTRPVLAMTDGPAKERLVATRDRLLAAADPTIWSAPNRRRGADILLGDRDAVQGLTLENKRAGGPGQFTSVLYPLAAAPADSAEAIAYHQWLTAASKDPRQMRDGGDVHDCRGNECTFWHAQNSTNGIPQVDYYCYYRDWLPGHITPAAIEDVIHVFLTGKRHPHLSAAYAKQPVLSNDHWFQVTYEELLVGVLAWAIANPAAAGNLETSLVIDELVLQLHWHMSWDEVENLPDDIKAELTKLGYQVTRPTAS